MDKVMFELIMVFKQLGSRRTDFAVSTKLFWADPNPNSRGLSRNHFLEGMDLSLKNSQSDYVHVAFTDRHDKFTPMEEIVQGFTQITLDGKAHHSGTSMWSGFEIEHR